MARKVMVRYKVKADRAEDNAAYIRRVFEELAQTQPDGLRYASFRQADGVSFVHIALIDTVGGNNPLAETAAFKAFQAEIKDRCEELPVAVELEEVGSYRCFGS